MYISNIYVALNLYWQCFILDGHDHKKKKSKLTILVKYMCDAYSGPYTTTSVFSFYRKTDTTRLEYFLGTIACFFRFAHSGLVHGRLTEASWIWW